MLMLLLLVLLIVTLLSTITCNILDDDKISLIVNIEHSIDNGVTFTNRSSLSVTRNVINDNSSKRDKDKNGIYDNDIEGFKTLLNNNGYYRIRVKSSPSSSSYITAAIPSCELQKSGFKEDIIIHIDSNDNIASLVYSSPVAALSKQCDSSKIKSSIALLTKLRIADTINAQTVPLQAIGPKPKLLQNVNVDTPTTIDKDGNTVIPPPPQQQTSWVRRNWYLIALGGYYIWRFMGPVEPEQPAAAKGTAAAAPAEKAKKDN
jgi:hypothetical protein